MKKTIVKGVLSVAVAAFFLVLAYGSDDEEPATKQTKPAPAAPKPQVEDEDVSDEFVMDVDTATYAHAIDEEEPMFVM